MVSGVTLHFRVIIVVLEEPLKEEAQPPDSVDCRGLLMCGPTLKQPCLATVPRQLALPSHASPLQYMVCPRIRIGKVIRTLYTLNGTKERWRVEKGTWGLDEAREPVNEQSLNMYPT